MQATIEPYLTTMLNGLEKKMFVKISGKPTIYTAVNNATEKITLMNGCKVSFWTEELNCQAVTKEKYIKGFLYRILNENGFDVCC